MHKILLYADMIRSLARTYMKGNAHFIISWMFIRYFFIALKKLLNMNITLIAVPTRNFHWLVSKYCKEEFEYVDHDSCAIGNIKGLQLSAPTWFYLCSKVSVKTFKILLIQCNDIKHNQVIVSETMKYNLDNTLHNGDSCNAYCLLPVETVPVDFAVEARISLISSPHEYAGHLVNELLEMYFSVPRFLRLDNIFSISVKEFAQSFVYSSVPTTETDLYFQVRSLKSFNNDESLVRECYVLRGETTLIQEANIHNYLPQKGTFNKPEEILYNGNLCESGSLPTTLLETLEQLESCIKPFIQTDIQLPIKPIFLLSCVPGSGKYQVIRACAQRMGLNLLNADFAEVQTLTSAQTEAKLRIVLHNAEQLVPCILCLNNIQVFGKTSEGQKDERIISAFANELNAVYKKKLPFPLIVIVTSDGSDIPAELQRSFIETIRIDNLDQSKKADLLSWFLSSKGLNTEADLSNVTSLCSDYRLTDLAALTLHAAKLRNKASSSDMQDDLKIQHKDFLGAYEYMQSVYSDSKDVPRVPKVYWDDIGGLASLKHEIMRRIQLPLLNAYGFGQSGLLLYGPPGTGKTLLAKAVATEYQLHFLSVKGPEVLNMYVGQSERNVRQIFERARAAAPCVIFFDELDSLAPNRGRSGDSGGVMDRVVSQLLAEMDGLEESSSIFIIGATNRPDLIDPALLRPGRFDKMLYVGIHSDRSSQLSVLQALTRKFKFSESGHELENILEKLPDHLTGADLYAVCSDAWLRAASRSISVYETSDALTKNNYHTVTVEEKDFLEAIRNLIPSVGKSEIARYERMREELSS